MNLPFQHTSLSRKILLRSVALLGSLLLLGGASVAAIWNLNRNVRNTTREYTELRVIETVRRETAQAIESLRAQPIDLAGAGRALAQADAALGEFGELQAGEPEGSQRHEDMETTTFQRAAALFDAAEQELAAAPFDAARLAAQLEQMHGEFTRLGREADSLVARTQERTHRDSRRMTLAIAGLFLIITALGIALSVSLYKGIMRPLRALRDGVRRIAQGQFNQRLAPVAEREFVELTDDFNRMAAELDGLYRNLEAKVAEKSRELVQSERLASVGFLAAGVAHEINNPLGIISGFAELSLKKLRNGSDPSVLDDARRTLTIIRDEAFRCREITEKLLTMARGGGKSARVPVDLRGVIDDVAVMVSAHKSYRDRRVEIEVNDPSNSLQVTGDEAELRQVLLNLCVNALDAVDPRDGRVRVIARREDKCVELEVRDNGCGMTPQTCEHVFEPFFTARRGETRGTGLGLSITRAIVESLGGSITAQSDGPGRGSCFRVRLPSADERTAQIEPDQPRQIANAAVV